MEILASGFVYGFLEYIIHRYLHITNEKRHNTHHLQLKNGNDFISSFYKSCVLFIFIYPILNYFVFLLFLQYVFYEFSHDLIHHIEKKNFLNKRMITYHMFHHYYKDWNVNYGVTTPFWDYIFNTMSHYHKNRVNIFIYFSWFPFLNFINFFCLY